MDTIATTEDTLQNGLTEAVMGFTPMMQGTQLAQTDTLMSSSRWYLISNMRQVLSEIYMEHGIVKTLVDLPVDDAFRGGCEIKTKQISTEEIEQLQSKIEAESIFDLVIGRGFKWSRLFGGGGIIIITDQDPMTPLDIDALYGSKLAFKAVDMWELYYSKQNTESTQVLDEEPEFYDYYGKRLHHSRVIKLKGLEAPSFMRPRLRGWGFSVVEPLVRSLNQFLKNQDLSFEVLDEFKLDIFKIKNLNQTLLMKGGTEKILARTQLANQQKNYQNALTMDSEDDYQSKQLSFSGLADVMKEVRMQIACDVRMPMTKLFGISASGFSSGTEDIENYIGMVEGEIRSKSKTLTTMIIKLLCKNLFNVIPEDLKVSFESLRVMTTEQEESAKNAKFSRVLQARQAGEITSEEFRDACNKDELLSIQLEDDAQLEDNNQASGYQPEVQ